MTARIRKTLLAALTAMTLAGAARADVRWFVAGTFDDGAALAGWFDINQYGFIGESYFATGNGIFAGTRYATPGTSADNTAFSVSYFPNSYVDGMILNFAGDLNVGVLNNALLPSSFECRTSYCAPGSSVFRYVRSGLASTDGSIVPVPEPAAWALMIGGFAAAGGALRRRVSTVRLA